MLCGSLEAMRQVGPKLEQDCYGAYQRPRNGSQTEGERVWKYEVRGSQSKSTHCFWAPTEDASAQNLWRGHMIIQAAQAGERQGALSAQSTGPSNDLEQAGGLPPLPHPNYSGVPVEPQIMKFELLTIHRDQKGEWWEQAEAERKRGEQKGEKQEESLSRTFTFCPSSCSSFFRQNINFQF